MIESTVPIAGVSHSLIQRWLDGRSFDEWREQFDREGYIIFESVLSAAELQRYRDALAPWLEQNLRGRNNFEGYRTNRVYAMLAKDPVFADMAAHPLALAFAEADLGTSCLLSAMLAINLLPGETVQPWHFDDGNIDIPTPRPSYGVSAFWALDDTSEENGATEIVPGSHLLSQESLAAEMAGVYKTGSEDSNQDEHARSDAIKAVMPAGSLMLTKGTLLHRGGANRSDKSRMVVTPQYCPGWARQLENMMAAVPPAVAKTLPERARQLIGYSIHGTFMGYVDGRHPQQVLT
ncbi:MAG: phytanoyl-CoA dioxygenase family protein [Gammaproteobacteria bacterium]|nr:phytanoyl-CoA dioxygenase family protein [Gammaproteobacteria bacterium]NND38806.1 phytanoyl-CoA dioxygenase family protein [Pseudomonadales bacterium]NNM10426.1 phytanoyl-CoA dioxygenase family protein [Pseudomonadales bacterium]